MSELKPCPFCGDTDVAVEQPGASRQSCIVVCTNCGVRLESNETGWGKWWNTRVGDAWISVDERLPEERVHVWVYVNLPSYTKPYQAEAYYFDGDWELTESKSWVIGKRVTHWMPLPEAPKEAT